jgi:hypothetical protein
MTLSFVSALVAQILTLKIIVSHIESVTTHQQRGPGPLESCIHT